nr:hypothetical protein [Pedobacter sp. ASV19]
MIMKLNPVFPHLARPRTEKRERAEGKKLTHEKWVTVDRVVIATLFALVIIGAIIFS